PFPRHPSRGQMLPRPGRPANASSGPAWRRCSSTPALPATTGGPQIFNAVARGASILRNPDQGGAPEIAGWRRFFEEDVPGAIDDDAVTRCRGVLRSETARVTFRTERGEQRCSVRRHVARVAPRDHEDARVVDRDCLRRTHGCASVAP